MANPNDIPLDFCMYEGKGKEIQSEKVPPPETLDVGGRVVLKLSDTLTEKSSIYVDRYFTAVPLLDKLLRDRNITATGTIMLSQIPRSIRFEEDATMRETRGSHDQLVRNDGNLAIIKWFDNRAIYWTSTESGVESIEKCTQWSKKEKKYIEVPRPCVVKAYNTYMGDVDLLDRMVGKYGMRAWTHKWTIRVIHHFIDFVIAPVLLEYRETAMQNGIAKKHTVPYYQFKLDIGENLIYFHQRSSFLIEPVEQQLDSEDEDYLQNRKRPRRPIPLPPMEKRKTSKLHLPEMMNHVQKSRSKCQVEGCRGLTFVGCRAQEGIEELQQFAGGCRRALAPPAGSAQKLRGAVPHQFRSGRFCQQLR
ncbi:uncharacterized protein LOC126263013 [Schistocerca nitens]|uniref:uncharacterized protein LOC126263013 n=1 Tax=Schistocerca nitens TaxID=7011 RepID=UPI0021179CAF|nr:uncharacterized protein LOC126263013 [Schistocerca nitens]